MNLSRYITSVLLVASCFLCQPAFAALPPIYQSLAELKAIINDPRLGEVMGSVEMIQEISRIPDDNKTGYRICGWRSCVDVDVVSDPQPSLCGPSPFHLIFHPPYLIDKD